MNTIGKKSGIHLDSLISPPPLSDNDVRKVQRIVATHSVGVEDCIGLLDMLGLNSKVDNS